MTFANVADLDIGKPYSADNSDQTADNLDGPSVMRRRGRLGWASGEEVNNATLGRRRGEGQQTTSSAEVFRRSVAVRVPTDGWTPVGVGQQPRAGC
jgi:hypothetical protein